MRQRPNLRLLIPLLLLMSSTTHSEQDPKILVMAHRGGLGLWPENTIYGYRRALETGVDILEIDVWLTQDNVVVVNHDETIDRTTNGTGAIRDYTLDQLQQFDAGYQWTVDGTHPYRGEGHIISTLDAILSEFPGARFNIDIKENSNDLIDGLGRLIEKHGASERVIVASFHQSALRVFRTRYPDVPTSAGSSEIIRFFLLSKLRLSSLYKPDFVAFQLPLKAGPLSLVTSTFVDAAHRIGVQVHPWTINDPEEMRRLITMGVDGIITDYPDRLTKILTLPSPQSPPPTP
jgi:glycerophosphoryl diester phosphodiesterase